MEKEQKINHYAAVDLGLPSGTKWAKCNVGATNETDFGLYFQWGDVVGYTSDQVGSGDGKKYFSWDDYKYCDGSYNTMTKYCTKSSYGKDGFTDNLTTLEAEDDAATVNMGKKWRLPTQEEFQELIDETDNEWTSIDGVNGRKFTSKDDSSRYIFIPAAGGLWGGTAFSVGEEGYYWSSSLYDDHCYRAWYLYFGAGYVCAYGDYGRFFGLPVRVVLAH